MASTSLAEQLQRLSVPQSTIYKDEKTKASLLFDPQEAGLKDRETFYEIGLSGLKELITLYEGFRMYEDTLFSVSSKDFERSVQTKEVNQNLNQTIEKFLLQLSPYLLLQSAHKALEWLVNRYHVHQYNQDAIMTLILPYHETKIFVRFVQLLDIKSSKQWNWLESNKKHGVPLAKQVLYNQCRSNSNTLQFIARSTLKYVQEFGERATQLNTVFAFFCSTAIGAINTTKRVTESVVNTLLPTVIKALESEIIDFRSSAYIVLGFLCTKASLKEDTFIVIVDKLLTTTFDLTYDVVLLINLMYMNQEHVSKFSEVIVNDLSVDIMNTLCNHLKRLVEQGVNIQAFTLAFLSSVLPALQNDSEQWKRFSQLPEILIDEVNLRGQQPEKIIQCVLDCFQLQESCNISDQDDESDLEIIDTDDFPAEILFWYSLLLRNIETKYPEEFDNVIKRLMSSDSNYPAKRRKQLSKVLGFKPAVSHKVGATYLFENLNHINPELRIEAIKYIVKEFDTLKKENIDFVKDSIVNRLSDDNPEVVATALAIPNEYLKEVLNEEDLIRAFVNIVSKGSKKWKPIVREALAKFCSLEKLPVNQEIVIVIVPYLFPHNQKSAELTWKILTSPWGEKFNLIKHFEGLKASNKDNYEIMNHLIFNALFVERSVTFDDILNVNQLNKDSTLDVCTFLLLKSCSFNKGTVTEITSILDLLLESVENRTIVPSSGSESFSKEMLPEFIKVAKQDKILFEFMEYMFSKIIDDVNYFNIPKPWCNVCETPGTILVRKLFEICITGCTIPNYNNNYVKLLQKLLDRFFTGAEEKFNFIANISFGHIFYATDPKHIISPELQLRCLKLLKNFIAVQENAKWLFNSDVIILMIIFNLNHPITAIRQCIIDFINALLREQPNENQIYVQLIKELLAHKEEILLDHQQISQVLTTILTQQTIGTKTFKNNCLLKLTGILIGDAPNHIKSGFLKIFTLNNTNTFIQIVPSLESILSNLKENKSDKNFMLDIYESNLIRSVYGRINELTVSTFDKEHIWESVAYGLREYRECILEEDQTFTSPCVLILKQIDEDVFKKMEEQKAKSLIYLIGLAGAFSNSPIISSIASKVMRKIHLRYINFQDILQNMLKAEDPGANKKKKSLVTMLSYQLTETDEWKLGVMILEYIQSKKKMSVDNSFVTLLFNLLRKCHQFEDQSYVEYTKQLILSSLWYFCKKFVDKNDKEQLKSVQSIFEVELIVQCIRGTQNPQTHHHALILLTHAAYMMPEQVLHHTMEIFTFMGSSVMRHDDAYSFQIISKIIETIIPILVNMEKSIDNCTAKEIQHLQDRVVPVLRTFVDVILHVPEHRRMPLYRKLMETLNPGQFLWVFICLLLEMYVAYYHKLHHTDEYSKEQINSLSEESLRNSVDFGQNLLLEFPPEICLDTFIKLIVYTKTLPLNKDHSMDKVIDPRDIFSLNGHTSKELRHYKYMIITFMSTCLSSSRFMQHCSQASDIKIMENHYKTLIVNILTFIQCISKVSEPKYRHVMLHHSYEFLARTNSLLSAPMFLSVIRGLLKHTLVDVRKKSMQMLCSKIQESPEMFTNIDKQLLYSLLPELLDISETVDVEDDGSVLNTEWESKQTIALKSLELLTQFLAAENPEPFKPVLEKLTDFTCDHDMSDDVMSAVVSCLAELCVYLKAHALSSLRKFMPALVKILKRQRKVDSPEAILQDTVGAISKIIESLPLFLSPYLQKILYEYSILWAKWQSLDKKCNKVSKLLSNLTNIKKNIASSIPPRILIPVANETHSLLLDKKNYDAVGPIMSVLADSFSNVTTADFTALQQDLTGFFLSALQLRSDAVEKNVKADIIDRAEDEVVNALVCLVLKLSETNFRPFYFKIYDWAIRTNIDGFKDREITFYRLSSAIAKKLKGLFVLFAGHFIKNAADLLDSCNDSKTEELHFDSEEKCIALINYIIQTLHIVFLYDSQNFINKDRFETLMQPIVDQLENTLGGTESLKKRAAESIIPCIAQFAVATADDSLWKLLNYQILLKIRHNDAGIRLTALDCLVSMATQLGSSWLSLLAESVPFLAELLEDGDPKIETATKDAIRKLEQILGEPLEKYF